MKSYSGPPIHMAGPDVGALEGSIVADAMAQGWYAPNAYKYVELFESEFAAFHDRAFGLMTPNCTTAIHLVLAGLGIGPGDEVIAPESTWVGSTAGITHSGASTVFADIGEDTWCLSKPSVEAATTPKTKAVVAVDLYGNMPRWESLDEYSAETGVVLIEDAAEALGSIYRGVRAGKYGKASVFSFHRTKTLTTGEGGMLLIDDPDLYERCKFLRDHGRAPGSYMNTEIAYKYMPSNVQAAIGHGQFLRIEELVQIKRDTFLRYRSNLGNNPGLQLNQETDELFNGAWATTVVFKNETMVTCEYMLNALPKRGIPVRPFFYPLSSLPAYAENSTGGRDLNPVAYDVAQRGIHLPCAMNLSLDQVDFISEALLDAMKCRS
jgi:perosamine synthetase